MAKQQGWIKLNRSFMDNEFWKEERVFSKAEAWVDLLLSAFFDTRTIIINNQSVKVEPGQYCTTMVHLAERWGWSRKKVNNFLLLLENEQMATVKRTSKYTLVTLLNWAKYQDEDITEEHQKSIKGTSEEHQKSIKRAQNKNVKNVKNVKNDKNNNIYILPPKKYGEYGNVILSDEELEQLKEKFPDDWRDRVERLSEYIASTGKKYRNHYATINAWARKDSKEEQQPRQPKSAGWNNKPAFKPYETDDIDLSIFEE